MSLRTFLQDHPTPLVWSWELTAAILRSRPVKAVFKRVGLERGSWWVNLVEQPVKHPIFNCQHCAQCLLHYNGMTCPMNCPKNLRNGPCGGVRLNGHCEVKPEMDCVWVKGIERAAKTPYAREIYRLNPPVDWRLEHTSSWMTYSLGLDQVTTGSETTVRYATEVTKK